MPFGRDAGASVIALLEIATEPTAPGTIATGPFAQSRATTEVTVSEPEPVGPTAATSTVKSEPPVVTPQGVPSSTRSTVYLPLPRLVTCIERLLNVAPHVPRWKFVAGVPGAQSWSFAFSSCSVTLTARSPVASPRTMLNGTLTQVCAGFRQRPAPFAATEFTAGAAVIVIV